MPENFRLGKPLFQTITRSTTLKDLIGPESHSLFQLLHVDTHWLHKPVNQWSADPAYLVVE